MRFYHSPVLARCRWLAGPRTNFQNEISSSFNKHTDTVIEFMNERFWFRQWVSRQVPLESLGRVKNVNYLWMIKHYKWIFMKLRKGFNLNLCGIWSVKRPTIIFALLIRLFVGGEETCTIFLPLPFLVTWLIYFREYFGWELSATSQTIMLVKIFLQYLICFLIESSPLPVLFQVLYCCG